MAWVKTSVYEKTESIYYQGLYIRTVVEGYYNTNSSTNHRVKYKMTYYLGNASSTKSYTIQSVSFNEESKTFHSYVIDQGNNKWYFDNDAWYANLDKRWEEPYTVGPNATSLKLTHSESEEFEWPGHVNIGNRRVGLKIDDLWEEAIDQAPINNYIIPDSPVPGPTTLTQYPTLFHPGDTLKFTLQAGLDADTVTGETTNFWDEGSFIHKIYILSDDIYQYLGGEAPFISVTSGREPTWRIPLEWNQIPVLAQYPDSAWPLDFYVETYSAGGMYIGTSAYYDSAIKYLPGGIIDGGEIEFDANWATIDGQTYNLSGDRKTIIKGISTVVVNVTGLGYFEGGFRVTVTNRGTANGATGGVQEVVQIGEINQTEFTFYQNCVSTTFYVKVEAAGYETTRSAWTGDLNNASGTFINYYVPIIKVTNTQMNSQGVAEVTIDGQVYSGYFRKSNSGTKNNLGKIEYRYYNTNTDSGWITVTGYKSNQGYNHTTFNWKTTLQLPVGYNYNLQARVSDNLNTTTSPVSVIMYRPVFDWSNNDFKFNVSVRADDGLVLPVGKSIKSLNDGTQYEIFAQDANNNTNVGLGPYLDRTGTTRIYGNEIDIVSNKRITINGKGYGEQRVLWEGGLMMSAGHTAYLDQSISEQPNGIILVFSLYRDETVEDVSINSFFVSKKEVELLPNAPHFFLLGINAGFSNLGGKYLYISDTAIKGHEGNDDTGTSTIAFHNSNYVLRYVIGV